MSYGRASMKVDGDLFRAVITTVSNKSESGDGKPHTRVEGPYTTVAPAKARITEARNHEKNWPSFAPKVVEAEVQKAVVTWERVE